MTGIKSNNFMPAKPESTKSRIPPYIAVYLQVLQIR